MGWERQFKFFTNILVLTFTLLIYLAWQTEATKSKIENMIEASKNQRVTSLKCHVCHSETDGKQCFNLTSEFGDLIDNFSKDCGSEYTMCVVKKFAVTSTDENGTTTPMRTFSIKRNCSKRCENGCVVMGERTRLYVCSQCCSDPLCNVGSGSASIHYIDNSFHHFLTSVANVHFSYGAFRHLFHLLELLILLSL